MALAPWRVLAGGKIRTDEEEEKRRQTGEKGRDTSGSPWERNEQEKRVCKALEKVAAEVGAKHINAGNIFCKKLNYFRDTLISSSCHCICHAEDTLCFSDYWRSKGRASTQQFRGIGNLVER